MKLLAEPVGSGRRLALLAGAITFAMLAVLAIAARAQASETIYWDNYDGASVSYANIDGSGGGLLALSNKIAQPEGMAFDPADGRIYIASSETNQIVWANVNGGGGVLDTGGAPVEDPEGVVVDEATQTVYWANDETSGSIGYASAGGGSGGLLNLSGASSESPYKLAIDTANNRIYWVNSSTEKLYSADLGGSGGSELPVSGGAPVPEDVHAINIDPSAGRLYWLDETLGKIGWVNVSGVGGGAISPGSAFVGPYGMAFDPSMGRFYWGNYSNKTKAENAIGTVTLSGSAGGITPTSAPVSGPQDPVILKSPTGAGAPAITQSVAALSCSQGSWSSDYPGSFVYGAPVSYAYQWLLNGAAIAGATASTYTATTAGSYTCSVTGKNVSGSVSQTSGAATVTPATLSLALVTKKAHAKAGKAAMVKLKLANSGDIASKAVKVCGKLTKKAKEGLVAPKCASVKALGNAKSAVATLRLKTKKSAKGTYKFTAQVKGAKVKSVTVSVKVTAPNKTKKKHHKKK